MTIRFFAAALTFSILGMFGGCATEQSKAPRTMYDLGMLPVAQDKAASLSLPPISVAEVSGPHWLDSRFMFYRLAYANDQQPQPYATSRWSMPPAQLFSHRLKARIGQAGGVVLSPSDGVADVPALRIEADEFTQVFTGPQQSMARINLRASVLNGRTLVAHKNFVREVPTPTPDAAGGARGLAQASDAIINDIMHWLAGLPLKK